MVEFVETCEIFIGLLLFFFILKNVFFNIYKHGSFSIAHSLHTRFQEFLMCNPDTIRKESLIWTYSLKVFYKMISLKHDTIRRIIINLET